MFAPVEPFLHTRMGDHCYKSVVTDFDTSQTDCFTLALSIFLGLIVLTSSTIIKFPQIQKVLSSRSASGLSLSSLVFETLSFTIRVAYSIRNNSPFSTYGEALLIAVQDIAVAILIFRYSGRSKFSAPYVAALAVVLSLALNSAIVSAPLLTLLQTLAGGMGVASKIPQIVANWKAGGTGVLSAFVVFQFLLNSGARIFTTWREVGDPVILYATVASFSLNAVLAGQMVFYSRGGTAGKGVVKRE